MPKYIPKSLLAINIFFCFILQVRPMEIDVCLWQGQRAEEVMRNFENKYYGKIHVRRYMGEELVINSVCIEKYLEGVLPREMASSWPLEALKAQAVSARTFAMNKARQNRMRGLPYDIKSSIMHQVYGYQTGCNNIKRAVEETAGEVLSFDNEVAYVFFHANCGGKTALPQDVWGGSYPYLVSVEDPYCAETPYFSWQRTFGQSELAKIMGNGPIEKISIITGTTCGRTDVLQFNFENGKILTSTGHRFRMRVNNNAQNVFFTSPDIIPSAKFKISRRGRKFILTGTGYGHGVGMCQWGARVMAEQGIDYRRILKHYFPQLSLKKHYE